jgi:hypothetical protein
VISLILRLKVYSQTTQEPISSAGSLYHCKRIRNTTGRVHDFLLWFCGDLGYEPESAFGGDGVNTLQLDMQLRLFRHFVPISVSLRVSSDALLITGAFYRFPSESQVEPPIVFGASSFNAQLAAKLSAAAVAAMVSVGLCSRVCRWQSRGRYSRQCQGLQHSHRSEPFQIRSDPPRPQRNRRIAAANSRGHLFPSPWSRLLIDITDEAPGMDEAFIRDELFMPFRSTSRAGTELAPFRPAS